MVSPIMSILVPAIEIRQAGALSSKDCHRKGIEERQVSVPVQALTIKGNPRE